MVARAPRYRRLFGPVSISSEYSRPSRALIARYLSAAGDDPAWRSHVRPRRPIGIDDQGSAARLPMPSTLEQLDHLVREMEQGRGVPVLVRQYRKLGARVLGCSVDPAFADCLDALMMVDLAALPLPLMQRYLGREGAAAFRAHHRLG